MVAETPVQMDALPDRYAQENVTEIRRRGSEHETAWQFGPPRQARDLDLVEAGGVEPPSEKVRD